MRVLLTSHQFPPKYTFGTEKLTFECGRELLARGHEVYVLTTEPASPASTGSDSSAPSAGGLSHDESRDYEYQGLRVRVVGSAVGETPDPLRYEYSNPLMDAQMRRYLEEVRPDLFHAWHVGRLGGGIIRVAKEEFGLPVVFTATDFWTVCRVVHLRKADTEALCQGPNQTRSNCLRCFIARAGGTPQRRARLLEKSEVELAAYSILAKAPVIRNSGRGNMIRAVSERVDYLKETINTVDRVVAPTRLTRDMLLKNGVSPHRLRLSRYGIETSHISSVERSPEKPEVMKFGFMGGMVRHKGVHTLIKAFRQLPVSFPARLDIYGDTDRDPEYFRELEELTGNDERVRFPGPFDGEKVGEVLPEVDVLVVPSAWYENTPLVIYEAFASGTPVVATNLGGLSEVIVHDENGLLFAVDDPDDLRDQLRRFLVDPELLGRLRSNIVPPRTVADSVDELEEVYGTLVRT